ncbi:MAG: tetratricopeptide repeat protein, partial [Pseudomonadota bacterium]
MNLRSIFVTLLMLLLGTAVLAQDDDKEEETKKTPAMREKVYAILSEAQVLLEEEENPPEALKKLGQIERMKDLNTYEQAQLYTFYGFVYFTQENFAAAVRSYERVLETDPPEALANQTLYTLAQLSFVTENYSAAVGYLDRWFEKAQNPGPQPYILLCQG